MLLTDEPTIYRAGTAVVSTITSLYCYSPPVTHESWDLVSVVRESGHEYVTVFNIIRNYGEAFLC